jgi:4-hydroxythreonine-4-phosphate dehydrogenase
MPVTLPVIALTPGEPAGIGPDLVVGLARRPPEAVLVIIADRDILLQRARQLNCNFAAKPWIPQAQPVAGIYIQHIQAGAPTVAGQLNRENAAYVLQTLDYAADGCLRGEFNALVTGPVHKGIINDAGHAFSGHTEYLAQRSATEQVVMMLVADSLRVALATTHLPLSQVAQAIRPESLTRTIEILYHDLQTRFAINSPRIAVCGLNPHAGEGGHLGREEIDIIEPVITRLKRKGLALSGPLPADTAFTRESLQLCDAVLAMYHDQGLPVLKHASFGQAVNVTLGLPFVRTSVDHGTALDLAGSGQARDTSLRSALALASSLTR